MTIPRGVFPFKVGHFHDRTQSFSIMNVAKVQTSEVLPHDLYWENMQNRQVKKVIECVHMTSRRPCWRSKQRNGGHLGGVKYSFGD